MDFDMTAVFHYGQYSEKHINRFQEKRLDMLLVSYIITQPNSFVLC